MSHATNRIRVTTSNEVRSCARIVRYQGPAAAVSAANEAGQYVSAHTRPIDPMLLVYQERVETFRMILATVQRGYRALAGRFATGNGGTGASH